MKAPNSLFVYGTLSFPEVISTLLGRKMEIKPATLSGFKRVRVKDKVYPALVKSKGNVDGVLLQDLTKDDVSLLDTFEDDFYDRISVDVNYKGRDIAATIYVVLPNNYDFVTQEIWDRDGFARTYLVDYLKMAREYRKNYLAGNSKAQDF